MPATRPVRVMHVVDLLGLAGMEYGVIKLANRLDPDRFSPMICCLRHRLDDTASLLDPRVPVFELHKRRGRDLRVVFRLAALFRRAGVDIVHSHNWQTFFYARTAAWLARVPVIVHGEHGRESQAIPHRREVLQRQLARGVTRLLAVSGDLARELVERWRVGPQRVVAIPNGVDVEAFSEVCIADTVRDELGVRASSRVVLNVGRLQPVKDLPTLMRAFARVHRRVPEARLLLVGRDGAAGTRAELEKLADDLGIRHAVGFAGIRKDVPQLLALADLYVNSSRFEGMSNTILEAMAAGKPVIATATGGNGELVQDGVTGYLVPVGDDGQMAERMERLLADPPLAACMGAAGRAKVEHAHALAAMVRAYGDLYEEVFWRYRLEQTRTVRERVKRWTARGLRWSGLARLTEMTGHAGLAVLTYHRVLPLPEASRYARQPMVMPRDLFEAQMAHLAKHYRVLTLPEAVRQLQEGRLPRRAAVVTFDDGYRDNYEHAGPILKKYGVPATFFVVTGVLDRTVRLWWDELAAAVRGIARSRSWREVGSRPVPDWVVAVLSGLGDGRSPEAVADTLITGMNRLASPERDRVLAALRDLPGAADERDDPMLTWEQVCEIARSGMHVGSHSVSHAFFDELDERRAAREIEESIGSLRSRLQVPITAFSYPRGRVAEPLRPVLVKAGIEAAVTTEPGLNAPGDDVLRLKRFDAGHCRTNGRFDPATFDAELQGWFNRSR